MKCEERLQDESVGIGHMNVWANNLNTAPGKTVLRKGCETKC